LRKALGAIRQDVNVSIKGGARVEIKGIQRLGLISKVIENEVKRQLRIISSGEKVVPQTRGAREDGSTFFMRPLPGSGRMYPETDIPPVKTKKLVNEIKNNLPESVEDKIKRYKSMGLSSELVNSLLKSSYFFEFEDIVKKTGIEPKIIASTLAYTLKDLKRRGLDVENLKVDMLVELFLLLKEGKIVKENIQEILEYMLKKKVNARVAVKDLKIKILSKDEIERIIEDAISKTKKFDKVMAIVMSKVRGKADPKEVVKLVKKKLSQ